MVIYSTLTRRLPWVSRFVRIIGSHTNTAAEKKNKMILKFFYLFFMSHRTRICQLWSNTKLNFLNPDNKHLISVTKVVNKPRLSRSKSKNNERSSNSPRVQLTLVRSFLNAFFSVLARIVHFLTHGVTFFNRFSKSWFLSCSLHCY